MSTKNNKVKHWLPRTIFGSLIGLVGVGAAGASGLSNAINLANSAGAVGGVLPWIIAVPVGLLTAVGGFFLVRSGVKRKKSLTTSKQEAKEVKEVTKSKQKALEKENSKRVVEQITKQNNVEKNQKVIKMETYFKDRPTPNSIAIYDAEGKNIKVVNGHKLVCEITGDENYKRYLEEFFRKYVMDASSGDCVAKVFGPDARQDENGELIGRTFVFKADDYKSQYSEFINCAVGYSQKIKANNVGGGDGGPEYTLNS